MRVKSIIIVILVCSILLISFFQIEVKAESKTIVVPDDFSRIQEAINHASEGDTIYVKKGVYHENVAINKSIILMGEDRDFTTIDGNTSQSYRVPINIFQSKVTVSNFTLSYGYAGIQFQGAANCTISRNRINNGHFGIRGGTWNNISDNIFEDIGLGGAIRFDGSTHNLVQRNFIDSCTEGIQVMWGSHFNTVTENYVLNCKDVGIRLQESDNNSIIKNVVKNSGVGISIYIANNNSILQNNFIENTIEVGADEWYAVQWGGEYSLNNWEQNHYSNYNGTDSDGDGIGDSPYIINQDNQDNSPLIEPIEIEVIPEFPSWIFLPIFVAITLVSMFYKKKVKKML